MKLKTLRKPKVEKSKAEKNMYGYRGKLIRMVERYNWRFIRFITYGAPFRRPLRPKMYMRARTLARPRRKISGHHRI